MSGWNASSADVLRAAQQVFEFRQRMAKDQDSRYRQPMLYRDAKWADLPAAVKIYHCDMVATAFNSFGIGCLDMPVFTEAA
jgi:hypothetical protein